MAQNRFRPYNKSLLANMFMSTDDYKDIWNINYVSYYDDINIQNQYGRTALMLACSYYNNVEIIRLLLSHPDINVNIQNKSGKTALMIVCGDGCTKIVRLLLNHPDIDINIQDNSGKTALIWADKNIGATRLLLQRKIKNTIIGLYLFAKAKIVGTSY